MNYPELVPIESQEVIGWQGLRAVLEEMEECIWEAMALLQPGGGREWGVVEGMGGDIGILLQNNKA